MGKDVQRVARAIAKADGWDIAEDVDLAASKNPRVAIWLKMARAAIAAMTA